MTISYRQWMVRVENALEQLAFDRDLPPFQYNTFKYVQWSWMWVDRLTPQQAAEYALEIAGRFAPRDAKVN